MIRFVVASPLVGLAFAVYVSGVVAADPLAQRFDTEMAPFIAKHCAACHASKDDEGKLALVGRSVDQAATVDVELWKNVAHQLTLGLMPPPGEERPTPAETALVVAWIGDALGDAAGTLDATQLPGFGNYIDHATLFTEPPARKAASPGRLWRISPFIFAQTFNSLARYPMLGVQRQGSEGLHPSLPFLMPPHSFRDQSPGHVFEDATTDLMVNAAWQMAGYEVDGPPRLVPRTPTKGKGKNKSATTQPSNLERYIAPQILAVLRSPDPTDIELRAAIRHQFHIVLHREPTPAETASLTNLFRKTVPDTGIDTALRTVLAAVLLKPEALFRIELGAGKADAEGRVRLTSREIAYAISYALTDDPPSAELLATAESGGLATAEDVRREVRRLFDNDEIAKPRMLRFFREYFEYTRADEVFKDTPPGDPYLKGNADHAPHVLVKDADELVSYILQQDKDVLWQLLTTPRMFVVYDGDDEPSYTQNTKRQRNLFNEYDLPREWDWTAEQPIDVSATRLGMLMHPAWLLAFSDNEKNQAIQRGLWIRTKLLGGTVPDVPIGVDARLPNDDSMTLREKMHVTRETYCAKCHSKMDSLGLPFEQFDYYGRHRTTEVEKPVDASGLIDCGDVALDGPVANPYEFVRRLADSRRVQQVFVRHAFRYWLGRNETVDDAPSLIDADRAYTESGGSMQALVVELLASDSFLYRKLPAGAKVAARGN